MRFTPETLKRLKLYMLNRQKVTIQGKNGLGQAFRVEGFIPEKIAYDKPGITDDCVNLFLGYYDEEDGVRKRIYTPFYVGDFSDPFKLYIERIYVAGDSSTLFYNPNFEDNLLPLVEESKKKYDLSSLEKDEKAFSECIGRVVEYEGKKAPLIAACKVNGKMAAALQPPRDNLKVTLRIITAPIRVLPLPRLVMHLSRDFLGL